MTFQAVPITHAMTKIATEKSLEMGCLKNSIRGGKGNLCGFLGEEVVLASLEGAQTNNTYQHDIVWNDIKLEVKTKDRTKEPTVDYEASVANFNTKQQSDYYVFVSLLRAASDENSMGAVDEILQEDIYQSSRDCLRTIMENISDPMFERAKRMLRIYGLSKNASLSMIIEAVKKNHKLDNQQEVLSYFGVDPRLLTTYTAGYITGMIPKTRYFAEAKFLQCGQIDPSNGWVVSADCYNLPYEFLQPLENLNSI